jgi:hypothetical protein
MEVSILKKGNGAKLLEWFKANKDEKYVRFARKMVSVVAIIAGVAAVVYAGLRR